MRFLVLTDRRSIRRSAPGRSALGRSTVLLAAGLSMVWVVISCAGPGYDREAMLGAIADSVIVPAHRTFVAEARALTETVEAFTTAPDSSTLQAVREQWLATELAWKGVEMFEFEGLLLVHNSIEKRPPRVEFIERTVGEIAAGEYETVNADLVDGLGSTTKGLAAIEYLVYPSPDHEAPVLEAFESEARSAFLHALTANVARKAEELLAFWIPDGENYAQTFRENATEGADIRGSISMLANNLIELYEMNMQTRLGIPMGRMTDGEPRPTEVEAPLSGTSLQLMEASLESVRATFAAGLDDYLDYLHPGSGAEPLAGQIHSQFDVVFEALSQIDPPLRETVVRDPESVRAAYEQMRTLLVLVKTDMAAQLGITVTFSDADGD